MAFGEPKMLTPEEMARMQKDRTLNDAELLNEGAEYETNDNGNLELKITKAQLENARIEMNGEYPNLEGYIKGEKKIMIPKADLEEALFGDALKITSESSHPITREKSFYDKVTVLMQQPGAAIFTKETVNYKSGQEHTLENNLCYIDADGNIAEIEFDYDKIPETKGLAEDEKMKKIKEALSKLGFRIFEKGKLTYDTLLSTIILQRQKYLEKNKSEQFKY